MDLPSTTRYTRRNLPHWEVQGGRYFVTVRCAGSLPTEVLDRLRVIDGELARIEPRSSAFRELRRRSFLTVEKYLDAAACGPLLDSFAAETIVAEFARLAEWDVDVPHFTVMPNHWHALLIPSGSCVHPLSAIVKRVKGRTAHALRARWGGGGPLWQREWFDHWLRDESEWERCVSYIRNNPVKAGLAPSWNEHSWTR